MIRDAAGFDAPEVIAEHSAGFAAAATGHLDAPVEHCPGWTVADLTRHLIEVQWFWATIVDECLTEPPAEDRRPTAPPDEELIVRFAAGADRLVSVLRAADPATPLWTWAPAQQDAGFVIRHQVQEAAVHHWDAGHAAGRDVAIAPLPAADAIEEFLTFSVSTDADPAEPVRPDLDGTFELRCTDIDRAWRITDGGAPGTVHHTASTTGPRPAVAATASELLLWLYKRVRVDTGAVPADLLDRFRALTFTD